MTNMYYIYIYIYIYVLSYIYIYIYTYRIIHIYYRRFQAIDVFRSTLRTHFKCKVLVQIHYCVLEVLRCSGDSGGVVWCSVSVSWNLWAVFGILLTLIALPVPLLKQVYFDVFLCVFFWGVFWEVFLDAFGSHLAEILSKAGAKTRSKTTKKRDFS